MNIVAIDVSKKSLDGFVPSLNKHFKIDNNSDGIKKLISLINSINEPYIVFEYTGGYENLLKNSLILHSLTFYLCSGKKVRDFAKSQGLIAKTDKLDAFIISKYAQASNLKPFQPMSKDQEYLKKLVTRKQQLQDLLNQEGNRFENQDDKFVIRTIQIIVKNLQKQITKVEYEIQSLLQNSLELKRKHEILVTIPGISTSTAAIILAELPELGLLSKSKITSLAGLAPMNQDSGSLRGYRKINHSRSAIKRALFMCTLSGIRCNPQIARVFKRLKSNGKPGKVALVACMRKLIVYMNAMLETQTPWTFTTKA